MSDTDTNPKRTHEQTPEALPPDERPGHERVSGDDPVIETAIEDTDGNEWFTVGDETGVICTLDPAVVQP